MSMTRRAILKTGGAAVVVLAAAGAGWVFTRDPKTARAPWRQASKGFGDPRLDALAYAILAPNPHNMQPWRVRLEEGLAFSVFCDLDRLLPETDPANRQVTIGFGCFFELLRQAAAEKGYRADVSYFPEGEPYPNLDGRPIAHVRLVDDPSVPRDPLFGDVLGRRTNRLEFDTARPVGDAQLAAIREAAVDTVSAFATSDAGRVEELRRLTSIGWLAEWSTPRVRRESIVVTRIGKAEIDADPNGIAIGGPLPEALQAVGVLTREKLDLPHSLAYGESFDFYNRACLSAMAHAWTTTRTNTRRDQLEAGRAWVRMQLAAASQGVAFHPLSQVLQEYPEMAPHYRRAHDLLAEKGETVQMLARLGYAPDAPAAPREPVESRLLPA